MLVRDLHVEMCLTKPPHSCGGRNASALGEAEGFGYPSASLFAAWGTAVALACVFSLSRRRRTA
jgi:hypothetical protein